MTCCGDRNSRRLEFPVDFQPFQPFQMRYIRHQDTRAEKYPRPLIFFFCASFFLERVSTPKLPQQNAFWVELEPILHLRTSMWGRAKGNFQWKCVQSQWKCVFPMEIPAESQGSPSGNQVVEMDPSRAGNVYKGQFPGYSCHMSPARVHGTCYRV